MKSSGNLLTMSSFLIHQQKALNYDKNNEQGFEEEKKKEKK